MELPVVNHKDYVAKIGDDHKFPINKFGELAKYLIDQKVVKQFHNPKACSFETLNNYEKSCNVDVFFALSHGVHRGQLKNRSSDDREKFIKDLVNKCENIRFDLFGMNNIQPIWADQYFKNISNSKMGLNLSRGTPIKYYSSDRITQIIGNGLVTLIDEKTCYADFFDESEMVFYKNITDLLEIRRKQKAFHPNGFRSNINMGPKIFGFKRLETVSTPDCLIKFRDLFKAVGVIIVENKR